MRMSDIYYSVSGTYYDFLKGCSILNQSFWDMEITTLIFGFFIFILVISFVYGEETQDDKKTPKPDYDEYDY